MLCSTCLRRSNAVAVFDTRLDCSACARNNAPRGILRPVFGVDRFLQQQQLQHSIIVIRNSSRASGLDEEKRKK